MMAKERVKKEAHEASHDVREDPEQLEKQDEIIQLLTAAGYFRARIKGLSSFDKVIGGMTWAIEMCNVDIDVDLLFHESLSIGQKISLTEKMVTVLQEMKCPHRLEPHQMSIQGMDFIHIFPVVQWLVKLSLQSRSERHEEITNVALNHFDTYYKSSELVKDKIKSKNDLKSRIMDQNPERMFRHPAKDQIDDVLTSAKTTLLEYGQGHMSSSGDQDKDQEQASDNLQEVSKVQKSDMSLIMSPERSHEVKQAVLELEENQKLILESTFEGRQLLARKQIENIDQEILKVTSQESEVNEKISELENKISQVVKMKEELKVTLNPELEDQETRLKRRELLSTLDRLKNEKSEFKSSCRIKKNELDSEICDLRAKIDQDSNQDKDLNLLKQELEMENSRLKMSALQLAEVTKTMARVQRRLDDIPSRSELTQYQRRFVELYNQIASKHSETKKYYILYNQLEDTKLQLERELNVLNSIVDNFPNASKSARGRDEFMTQLQKISESVISSKAKIESRQKSEQEKLNQLNRTYSELIDKTRLYHRATDKFKNEVSKHEMLLAQLEQQQQD